jgi:Ca-activated chloride channel family protein
MRWLIIVSTCMIVANEAGTLAVPLPQQGPVATFKSSIDLVRINAVVRDKKGRFVLDLNIRDFEVLDGGISKRITEFRRDEASLTVALLFDVSGSMEARMTEAQEAATHLLSWMSAPDDEAGVFTFDTQLVQVSDFRTGMQTLPPTLGSMKPFGATSLHDAIAQAAERVAKRPALRRAVVVFTDGRDNASKLTPSQVSGIASSIDVPVYIIGIVAGIDNPGADVGTVSVERSALTSDLSNLAFWTGGDAFVVSTISERSLTARQLVDELRHQYLIAFESSTTPGWHPLVVKMRDKDLTVRARSGYIAGQSRPIS